MRSDNVYMPDLLGALKGADDGDADDKQAQNFLMQSIYLVETCHACACWPRRLLHVRPSFLEIRVTLNSV